MLGAAGYLVGAVALGAVLAVVGCGSWRVREALLPGWQGAIARLAELVIGLFVVLTTAQVLGAIGAFDRVPVLAAELAVGAALYAGAGRPRPRQSAVVSPAAPVLGRVELAGAALGVGLVVVQWATHVAYALSKGMTYSDTMWYHQPFAARFVQHHSFSALDGVGLEAARRYPLSSPLLHALGMLAFNRDIVSPFINLGWLLLALLAAWCIGRRSGLGHVCTLGAAVAVGLPILTATQPGQASSDVAAVALFLAAVALLLESDLQPAPTAIGGLALGMALSMKITVAAPAAVLALGVVALAWRARRLSAVLWMCALGASGSFWFLRNWWLVGSPVPWFDVRLGPLHLRVHEAASAVASGQPSLAHGIANTDVWPDFYLDALWRGFGR
ncbi:MAG: hypothetical protein QOH79_2464, partial [Acidimicrobiaceae bacterium]